MTPFEQGYESETLCLTFKDNPYPTNPMTEEAKQWISGKCKAINDHLSVRKPPKAIIAYADQ